MHLVGDIVRLNNLYSVVFFLYYMSYNKKCLKVIYFTKFAGFLQTTKKGLDSLGIIPYYMKAVTVTSIIFLYIVTSFNCYHRSLCCVVLSRTRGSDRLPGYLNSSIKLVQRSKAGNPPKS